jgi:GNAT superfamily N-acetyltransferase
MYRGYLSELYKQLSREFNCSEDATGWLQIGIDVIPEYRSKGVGTFLVTTLKNKIIEQGDIPFYGTSASNYHSWNIALNSGFKPAWVEIGAKRLIL